MIINSNYQSNCYLIIVYGLDKIISSFHSTKRIQTIFSIHTHVEASYES